MPRRLPLALAALAGLFLLSSLPYLALAPAADDWKNLWLVQNVPPWRFLTDPLIAGYTFRFYFEPTWPLLYYVDTVAAPLLGNLGHHLVNAAGAVAIGIVLARMVAIGSGSTAAALGAASVFWLSSPVWFAVGFGPARNYVVATCFSLLATLPFWRAYFRGRPCSPRAVGLSALAYALAVGSKEATAALPLLLVFLDLRSGRSLPRAVVAMVPHAAALAGLLAWRVHLLGGIGGYWMEPEISVLNLVNLLPMLADMLWGSAWPLWLLVPLLALRPALAALLAAGYVATAAPFILAGDILAAPHYPLLAVRFLLVWALLVAVAAIAAGTTVTLGRVTTRGALIAFTVVALLALQFGQRPPLDAGLRRFLPPVDLPLASDDGIEIHSEHSKAIAYAHMTTGPDRPPLAAFQTPPSYQLARGLGFHDSAGLRPERIRDDWGEPELVPLEMHDSRIWADDHGRIHMRLAADLLHELYLTWVHDNGPTRWVVTMPIGRQVIDFPLTPSIRAIILARLSLETTRWEVFVWESPFFQETYP